MDYFKAHYFCWDYLRADCMLLGANCNNKKRRGSEGAYLFIQLANVLRCALVL